MAIDRANEPGSDTHFDCDKNEPGLHQSRCLKPSGAFVRERAGNNSTGVSVRAETPVELLVHDRSKRAGGSGFWARRSSHSNRSRAPLWARRARIS